MPYDYGRKQISSALGLSGVEADHIAQALKAKGIDPETIDWRGAMTDARDYADRYRAVKDYLFRYYGITLDKTNTTIGHEIEQYAEMDLDYQASSKEGIKQLLKTYFNQNTSRDKREAIRNVLLSSAAVHNVLMVSLYDGADMPLAKRFLLDEMSRSGVVETPVSNINKDVVREIVMSKKKIVTPNVNVKPSKNIMIPIPIGFSSTTKAPVLNTHIPKVYAIKSEKFLKYHLRDTGNKLWASAKGMVGGNKPVVKAKDLPTTIALLQKRNEAMRQQMEPLRMQIEYQTLVKQQQQLQQLAKINQKSKPGPATLFLANFFGQPVNRPMRPQNNINLPGVMNRSGYHIEASPKLPSGYRWVKDKKINANLPKSSRNPAFTEHRFITYPEAQAYQHYMMQQYGYMPEIHSVNGFGQQFFVVVEPKGLKKGR